MTHRDEHELDAGLARAWREASSERTPAELDRRILDAARHAVPGRRAFPPDGWYRPLAYAATLVLGVALILDVTNRQPAPGSPPSTVAEPAPPAEESFDTDAAGPPTGAGTDAQRQDELPARRRTAPVAADEETRLHFEKSAESAGRALSEIATTAPAGSREEREADGRACGADSRATPAAWLACIEALEAAGETQAAAEEKRLLEEQFPGLEAPHWP